MRCFFQQLNAAAHVVRGGAAEESAAHVGAELREGAAADHTRGQGRGRWGIGGYVGVLLVWRLSTRRGVQQTPCVKTQQIRADPRGGGVRGYLPGTRVWGVMLVLSFSEEGMGKAN